jgi:hypothetical protein
VSTHSTGTYWNLDDILPTISQMALSENVGLIFPINSHLKTG